MVRLEVDLSRVEKLGNQPFLTKLQQVINRINLLPEDFVGTNELKNVSLDFKDILEKCPDNWPPFDRPNIVLEDFGCCITLFESELNQSGDNSDALWQLCSAVRWMICFAGIFDPPVSKELLDWCIERLRVRQVARSNRDFATSDAIPAELNIKGIDIKDSGAGTSFWINGHMEQI